MKNMTNKTDNENQSDTTSKTTSETTNSLFLDFVSTEKASEKFVVSMKDIYQELKSAPTGRANIRQ
jgi:hypothetical protein